MAEQYNRAMGSEGKVVYNVWPETARMLNISRATAYSLAAQGITPTVRLGRRLVVPRVALEKMLAKAGQKTNGHNESVALNPRELIPEEH